MEFLYIYLAIINIAALVVMGIDKYYAVRHRWRIPERTLFLMAILGGSIGSVVGMVVFWHKVRKGVFLIGLPVIMIVHLVLLFAFML